MPKVRIRLIQLGYPSVDLRKVLHWKSKLFEVVGIQHKADLPNSDGDQWTLSKKRLTKVIGKHEGADITFAVTDRPIENNYYMHRLTDQICVLSFYQVSGILAASNLQPEMFVLRNIYEMTWRNLAMTSSTGTWSFSTPGADSQSSCGRKTPKATRWGF